MVRTTNTFGKTLAVSRNWMFTINTPSYSGKFFKDTESSRTFSYRMNRLIRKTFIFCISTPPYKDRNITEPKEVYIQLCRKSDGDRSEPRKFTYKPNDRIISK